MFQSLKQLYWDIKYGPKRVFSIRKEGVDRVLEILGKQWRWKRRLTRFERILYLDRYSDDFSEEDQRYYLDCCYREKTGKTINWDNPQTFNEKLQWLKLYYHNPLMTQCSDKVAVRDFVAQKIGEEYLIPAIGVYSNPDEIDFDALPDRFVLKVNWGSGQNIICKDKSTFDVAEAKRLLWQWLQPKSNLYFSHLEWCYKNIVPKIICEQFIENNSENHEIYDYKFFCFNGKVAYIMFLAERQTGLKMAFFDTQWEKQDFVYSYPIYEKKVSKPENLSLMISVVETLAKDFPEVRVDVFRMNDGHLYLGEMTFYSYAGYCNWNPPEWDLKLGQMIQLPEKWL
ncbi:MAG: hypothetical protein IJG38_04515 [Thermoguttaceae bacterium]|nr:hypothetical protein [Thermoguttaceae bacterium]